VQKIETNQSLSYNLFYYKNTCFIFFRKKRVNIGWKTRL